MEFKTPVFTIPGSYRQPASTTAVDTQKMHQQTNRMEIRRSVIIGDEFLSHVNNVLCTVTNSMVKLDSFTIGGTHLEIDIRVVEAVRVFLGGLHHFLPKPRCW